MTIINSPGSNPLKSNLSLPVNRRAWVGGWGQVWGHTQTRPAPVSQFTWLSEITVTTLHCSTAEIIPQKHKKKSAY